MGAATCSWCKCDVGAIDRPVLCDSCGNAVLPGESGPEAEVAVVARPAFAAPQRVAIVEPLAPAAPIAPLAPVAPVEPLEPPAKRIVGHTAELRSLHKSLHFTGREGLLCLGAFGAYAVVALTFLAIVSGPFTGASWAMALFVVWQGFAALLFAGARWLNRRGLVEDVERAGLWLSALLLPGLALGAGAVMLHSLVAGLFAAALLAADAWLVHGRLAMRLPAGPARTLKLSATGLVATAAIAPLAGALPALVSGAVALLLGSGERLLVRRAEGDVLLPAATRLRISALLLLGALAATMNLTRGAWELGAVAHAAWGMLLTSLVLVFRECCAADPELLPPDARRMLPAATCGGVVAGFALTFGEPLSMLLTGAIAAVALLRASLRHERPALLVPAFAVAVAAYAWLPDPWSVGADSLRLRLVPWIATFTGGSEWATWSLWFAPCAALLVVGYGLLAQRGRAVHARVVAAVAMPAVLAVGAGLLASALQHASLGVALAGLGVAGCWCGQLARKTLPVAFGSVALLLGVGAAAAALKLQHAGIELALALAVLGGVATHAALARGASDFAKACARRWVDGATLFGLVAIPVAWSAVSLRYPHDVATAANEIGLALLAFALGRAWRRPEPAIVAGVLVGRAAVGLIELGGREVAALQGLQIVAAASALGALLTLLTGYVPLERRVLPRRSSRLLAGLLCVLAIVGVGCVRYGRSLVGIGQDVPGLVITSLAVLLPLAAVVLAARLADARGEAAAARARVASATAELDEAEAAGEPAT